MLEIKEGSMSSAKPIPLEKCFLKLRLQWLFVSIAVFSIVSLSHPLSEEEFYEAERFKEERIHYEKWWNLSSLLRNSAIFSLEVA